MKSFIFLTALAIVVLSCKSDNVRSFIPGTYVSTSSGEFSIASDTLVIKTSESNNFYVHRKTGFNRINDGKIGKREQQTENWNAVYDESTKTLNETSYGKQITFYPDSGMLMLENERFRKIN